MHEPDPHSEVPIADGLQRWAILQQNCGYLSRWLRHVEDVDLGVCRVQLFPGEGDRAALLLPGARYVPAAPLLWFAPGGAPCAGLDESSAALGLRLGRFEQPMSDRAAGSVPAQL